MMSRFDMPIDDQRAEAPQRRASTVARSAGWLLLIVWLVSLGGYAGWKMWQTDGPWFGKILVVGGWSGVGLLLLSVLLDRLRDWERIATGGAAVIVVISETVVGRRVVRTLGLVRGNTIRARHPCGRSLPLTALLGVLTEGDSPERLFSLGQATLPTHRALNELRRVAAAGRS